MKSVFAPLFFLVSFSIYSQTATNFSCKDCDNVNHDFFAELDAGKVIIIDWVMPCSSCTPATVKAHNIVNNFAQSNPGKVFLYIVDDYANTNCSNLKAWADAYGISNATFFSNAAIKMSDYGTAGMPKIIVAGCYNHQVFYNEKNTAIDSAAIVNAVNAALGCATGLEEAPTLLQNVNVYPNPTTDVFTLSFTLSASANITVYVSNVLGQKMAEVFTGKKTEGNITIEFDSSVLPRGMYLIRYMINDEVFTKSVFKQ
ncbi:MAG: T9SS type A sorting domain-containing protein [Flavobacteriales bacterium]|nr:T9SS type A sorting domain-containing protein [Flavobacteriales bacterium]